MARPVVSAPPVLEGERDRPFLVTIGAVAALALSLMAGLTVASTPEEGNGVYTSAVLETDLSRSGRQVYLDLGCAACHTQMVRPLVVDAGLGGVTIADSDQVIGSRRLGPDLTDVASRAEDATMFGAVLAGADGHPAYAGLCDGDVEALVAYWNATNAPPVEDEADTTQETTEEDTES
jgi:mono/diheme cytochrome c family protein